MSIFRGLVMPPGTDELPFWHHFTHYSEIQAAVGGSFEVFSVEAQDGRVISTYCDGEGLYHGAPMNKVATGLRGYPILGTVVYAGGVDDEGEQLSLDNDLGLALVHRWAS